MSKPTAVVIGFIGKLPFAGMTLYNLHYLAGLQALGYDVHYVERQNKADDLYDPVGDIMTDDPAHAIGYLCDVLPKYGVPFGRFSFIDRQNRCHCTDWSRLREAIARADFILSLTEKAWCEEFAECPRRAFVDGDPLFTQAAMLEPDGKTAALLANYDTLFTYATRLGLGDCEVPTAGRVWIGTRPVVATRFWNFAQALSGAPVTAVAQWTGGSEVTVSGRTYGYKNRELGRFMSLPQRTAQKFVIAVGGRAPAQSFRDSGWNLADPLEATGTIASYQAFISNSRADLGIAKHAFVASRSGWFSDRSTCYLAAGRPVLHQDTGFTDWLPEGHGVFPFASIEDVLEALKSLDADYDMHAKAARNTAEDYFEAATVVGRMLDDCGYR